MELRPGLVDVQGKSKRDKYITPLSKELLIKIVRQFNKIFENFIFLDLIFEFQKII